MAATTAYSSYFPQDPGPAGQASSFPAEMGYQSSAAAYGQPDTAARQPSQGYAGYPTSMMYNVPQSATGSSQSASGFESSVTSQFGTPRHHHQPQSAAAMQMLSTGMASPYFAADSSSTSAAVATSTLPNQAALYQQNDPGIAGFATGDMGGMPGLADAAETRGSASISRPAQEFGSEPLSGDGLGKNYAEYKAMLREVFSDIKATRLVTAADTLIKLSERLLTKVDELGKGKPPALRRSETSW